MGEWDGDEGAWQYEMTKFVECFFFDFLKSWNQELYCNYDF